MSVVLTSLLVAGGVIAGRALAEGARRMFRRRGADDAPPEGPRDDARGADEADEAEEPKRKAPPARAAQDPFAGFPCRLGDVVLAFGTDEAWLAGAILFSEEVPAAALFIAPDAGGDRAILARPRPVEDLLWLTPIAAGAIRVGAEPPSSLEHDGARFERLRRLPYRAARHGSGAPDVGDEVVFAEYKSEGNDHLVLLVGRDAPRAWVGRLLSHGMYDVLASDKTRE